MTQVEFERALARTLKSIFDDANVALGELRRIDSACVPAAEAEDLEDAIEGLCVVCAKIETLKFFADSMVEGCE